MTTHKNSKPVPADVFRRALETYKKPVPLSDLAEWLAQEQRSREACDRVLKAQPVPEWQI